jgi:hypothetical protein
MAHPGIRKTAATVTAREKQKFVKSARSERKIKKRKTADKNKSNELTMYRDCQTVSAGKKAIASVLRKPY